MKSTSMKMALSLGLMVMLLMSPLALSQTGMGMQSDGMMGHCPFMIGDSICTMTPLAHIAASQSFLTAIVQLGNVLALLLLSLSLIIAAASLFWKPHAPPDLVFSYARAQRREFIPVSYLQEAFASGILNPKVF